ncbi:MULTISPECIES: HD-GYP domain-containing protein [Bacillus]|uniref:HD-GYP domain-containing protein n=1 Tax=Bacillus TaxID=1386 RepID=UPI000BB90700|nr:MULTISPECIES: HD-GYP domain-containing protein [Bacillus]
MLVNTGSLVEGCILAKNIKSLTNKPIITKNTILTPEHIKVLESFLIDEVEVEPTLANGEPFLPKEMDETIAPADKEEDFVQIYFNTVQNYKKLFGKWQSGAHIDYGVVRQTIIPLIERLLAEPRNVRNIHHYSNKRDYLYHHAVATSLISVSIAQQMQLEKREIAIVAVAAFLMDCGMCRIDSKILQSVSILKKDEFVQIKEHPIYSYQMVSKIPYIQDEVKLAILQHHERQDRSGYPFGLQDDKLHTVSRIISVADVYHAMTSERMYRPKQSPYKVLEQLQQEAFGKFDLLVVKALIAVFCSISIGTIVKLSSGDVAEVAFIEQDSPTRPMVKVQKTGEFISLKQRLDLYIEDIK